MSEINIDNKIYELSLEADEKLAPYFKVADEICNKNSEKVLNAFLKNRVSYQTFEEVTGYGFFDTGRDKVEQVFADVFGTEDALVRPQIMSGTNAIYLTLSGLLHPDDTLMCICGAPYDPLQNIVGTAGTSKLSLINNGVKYEQIEMIGDDLDLKKIEERLKKGDITLVEIQRSCGYSARKGLTIKKIEEVCHLIKSISPNTIIMCDNCYGEFVEEKEPTNVGVDIIAGSLMHNVGGGHATSGGYIAGKEDLILQVADRLTAPGMEGYLGANYNQFNKFLKGLYMAPTTVCNAVKTSIFTAYMMEQVGFKDMRPRYYDKRSDIIQTIDMKSEKALIEFCVGLQNASPVDSYFTPVPCEMPGYPHNEIMGAGTFTLGSTIELTCDAPVVEPYTVFVQGGISFSMSKISIMMTITHLLRTCPELIG